MATLLISIQGPLYAQVERESSRPKFSDFVDNYYQEGLKLFPLDATYYSEEDRYNDLLHNDITPEHRAKVKAYYTHYLEGLGRYENAELTGEQETSYGILRWECEINLAGLEYPKHLIPIDHYTSMHVDMGELAGGRSAQPFKSIKDYENWLKRLDVFVAWCDTAIANMGKGMEQGVVLPKSLSEKVVPQLAGWIEGPAEEHHFYSPVQNLPETIGKEEAHKIRANYKAMVEGKLIPVFNRLHDFFQNEYLPAGRATAGYSALPNGVAWYQHLIRRN